jgi:ribosomal protein S18 acetylase RimI-like enzyme
MPIHGGTYLRFGGPRSLRKKFDSLDDHTVETIAALNGLFIDHGLLYGMQHRGGREFLLSGIPSRQALESRDGFAGDVGNRCHARTGFNPIHKHRTGTALTETASKARPLQVHLVRKNVKKRCVCGRSDRPVLFIDFDFEVRSHRDSPKGYRRVIRQKQIGVKRRLDMMSAVNLEPELKIRKIDDAEVFNLAEVWHFTKKAAYSYLPLEQFRTFDEDEKFFREKILPRCDVWAADDNGRITGFLAIQGTYVDRLYVLPNLQRRGIGGRLILHAKALSPDGLELHTHRKNIPAWKFYEKHGFLAFHFGMSPPPESEPDIEFHWRPDTARVRKANIEDAAGIAAVHVQTWQAAYRGQMPDDFLNELDIDKRTIRWREWAGKSDTWVLVVEDRDHRIAGFSSSCPSRDADADTKIAEIRAIYVHPEKWRKGVGRSLMSASLANVRDHGFDAITLWVLESNAPARAFYESIGFAVEGASKTVQPRADFSIREVRYRLDLK